MKESMEDSAAVSRNDHDSIEQRLQENRELIARMEQALQTVKQVIQASSRLMNEDAGTADPSRDKLHSSLEPDLEAKLVQLVLNLSGLPDHGESTGKRLSSEHAGSAPAPRPGRYRQMI